LLDYSSNLFELLFYNLFHLKEQVFEEKYLLLELLLFQFLLPNNLSGLNYRP